VIYLRRGSKREQVRNPRVWCGADATMVLSVYKDQHVTCEACFVALTAHITEACNKAEAWLATLR
jgi:hypothetical protein